MRVQLLFFLRPSKNFRIIESFSFEKSVIAGGWRIPRVFPRSLDAKETEVCSLFELKICSSLFLSLFICAAATGSGKSDAALSLLFFKPAPSFPMSSAKQLQRQTKRRLNIFAIANGFITMQFFLNNNYLSFWDSFLADPVFPSHEPVQMKIENISEN